MGVGLLYLADFPLPMPYARSIQTLQTCMALGRQGCDVTLFAGQNGHGRSERWLGWYGLAPHPHVRIIQRPVATRRAHPYHARYATYELQALWWLAQAIRRRSAEAVVVRTGRLARLCVLTGLARRLPVILEVHRQPALDRCGWYRHLGGIVTLTEQMHALLAAHVGDTVPVTVIRDGASAGHAAHVSRRLSHIAFIGQWHHVEGVDILIRAMAWLPNVVLYLIGGIDDAQGRRRAYALRRLADTQQAASRIVFAGAAAPRDVPRHLAEAAVAVMPYLDDPSIRCAMSPLKVFEAMAAGTPIVASDVPALREVLRDGENALLVPPNDPMALARGIARLLNDRTFAVRLAAQARADAAEYTWDRRAAKLAAFCRRVVEGAA